MHAEDLLATKGTDVFSIEKDELIATAVSLMAQKNIGALVVLDEKDQIVGVVSERDIVRQLSLAGAHTLQKHVEEVMSDQVLICHPGDEIKELMALMTHHHVRHLPVLENGHLEGVVSIGDIMKSRLREVETERHILRERLLAKQ